MIFSGGDKVEVSSQADGFVGSYFSATVMSELMNEGYVVQYMRLLKEDMSSPLREIVAADEVRPFPPKILATEFRLGDKVDAFANDGWWVSKITGKNVQSTLCISRQQGMRLLTLQKILLLKLVLWLLIPNFVRNLL
ncbi:hypothetical protein RJ639_026272 [Escallonia herrerae]|uniref:Agenet domain-containing protein n=1 Tax=Escallonia herrerae TaxID=1293975 RepID=A0AA88S611_9ASTE|nr:hypothetical protein RJ639_026272 [Escallonia herrerae]